jgi:hypothetical protein
MLTLIITALFAVANVSPEQIAFNYFASQLIDKEYPDLKVIYFSGQTEVYLGRSHSVLKLIGILVNFIMDIKRTCLKS